MIKKWDSPAQKYLYISNCLCNMLIVLTLDMAMSCWWGRQNNIYTEENKTVFKYQTRMENYGKNYRGGKSQVFCPLCSLHLDNQEQSFQCQVIKDNLNLTGDVQNLYKENTDVITVKALCKISDYRKQMIWKKYSKGWPTENNWKRKMPHWPRWHRTPPPYVSSVLHGTWLFWWLFLSYRL